MTTSALRTKNLKKKLNDFILGPIDLDIQTGTVAALIGAHGSGKSTLLRVLMNAENADEGTMYAFGQEFSENETALKHRIGYLGDRLEAYHHLTIKELASQMSREYPTWDHHRYLHYLERYQLNESMKYEHGSTGTRKKIELILLLCFDSSLLVLDEPSSGMDMPSQRKMKEDLLNYMEDGERSILLATHVVAEVEQLADSILVMDEGKMMLTFHKDDIHANWAKVWVSEVTDSFKDLPHVLSISENPSLLVTNNLSALEIDLNNQQISIKQIQRLTVEEVIENLTS